ELARAAADGGTTVLAATPHARADHPTVRPPELAGRCEMVNGALGEAGVALEVVPGGEVDIEWARRASAEELRLVSYGQRGTDLLVESPYGPLSPADERLLDDLAGRGFRVLLAHPERNPTFQQEPERVRQLVERGFLVQVTARAVVPADRPSTARRLAVELVEAGVAHVLASDAHGASRPAPPDLAAGHAAATEIVGARADWMVRDAPAAILAGEPLPPPP
nr:hypothetical protein [Actinomycetota bacterium]